jgi:3-oxo-4,17-pregnadiene-20-carboxyl-CoA hydratase alpha subunit
VTAEDAGSAIRHAAARIAALGESGPRAAPDPVNLPMIRHWVQAMGDTNPVYTDAGVAARSVHGGLVAPPAMTQVWTMRGLQPAAGGDTAEGDSAGADTAEGDSAGEDAVGGGTAGGEEPADPLGLMSAALDEAGFTSVVATNSEQEYYRYLRLGERVTVRSSLEGVTGPKQTALGEGWFVTTRSTWYVGTEAVATMKFRILKFRAAASSAPPEPPEPAPGMLRLVRPEPAADVLRPVVSPDTAFFWEGTARHELRIQRCGGCGTLRHPPGPMCPVCGFARPEYDVAAGTGEVYSYVVHHHPPVPGRKLPIVIALVQLTEGVRMVGELIGADPERVRIGLPVRVTFVEVDDDLTLPAWQEDQR